MRDFVLKNVIANEEKDKILFLTEKLLVEKMER